MLLEFPSLDLKSKVASFGLKITKNGTGIYFLKHFTYLLEREKA